MEYIDIELNTGISHIPIDRKSIKTVRLKVYPDGKIRISAPHNTSYRWINDYAHAKVAWIKKKVSGFELTNGIEAQEIISNGSTVRLLGEDYFADIIKSNEKQVNIDETRIVIFTPNINNQTTINTQLEKWAKQQLINRIELMINQLYPIVKKHNVAKPNYSIRKMRTLWGSCNKAKNSITFNYYLYHAKPLYIEYVVLHELIHLIHRNHTKEFYSMLSLYMPDWKDRKKYLDNEVMQGVRL